jgi:hypothetical protein
VTHDERIAATAAAFDHAMSRFLARIESASDEVAERPPADGGWTVAGIAWHVSATNNAFAAMIDGSLPVARAPEEGFEETPFSEITSVVPDQLEAPEKFHPPAGITRREALSLAADSKDRLLQAIRGMPEGRGLWTIKSILGLVTIYQVGEWAAAHVARHNAQAKRVIG